MPQEIIIKLQLHTAPNDDNHTFATAHLTEQNVYPNVDMLDAIARVFYQSLLTNMQGNLRAATTVSLSEDKQKIILECRKYLTLDALIKKISKSLKQFNDALQAPEPEFFDDYNEEDLDYSQVTYKHLLKLEITRIEVMQTVASPMFEERKRRSPRLSNLSQKSDELEGRGLKSPRLSLTEGDPNFRETTLSPALRLLRIASASSIGYEERKSKSPRLSSLTEGDVETRNPTLSPLLVRLVPSASI
jgi:hypothetical protein